MAKANGSIGTRQNLEVRDGHTLAPQIAVLSLASGQPLDATGATLVLRIYKAEGDRDPLASAFDPPTRIADDAQGNPRWLITQSRALLSAVMLAAGAEPSAPASATWRKQQRRLWWTCSYQDASGRLFPAYYGTFTVYLGASGG